MNSGAIAIFVKTPGRSPLKTRLAADTGAAWALQWYALACSAVAEVAGQTARAAGAEVYWAVAEADALAAAPWSGLPCLAQGDGGLGARLARVHATLVARHGAGVLLGADTPQLEAFDLQQALDWLKPAEARQCLGPATDGGFWLYGSNRSAVAARWEALPWSQTHTAHAFRAAQAEAGAWLELPMRRDVDTVTDLDACLEALRALPAPTPAQSALRDWMQSQPPARGGVQNA